MPFNGTQQCLALFLCFFSSCNASLAQVHVCFICRRKTILAILMFVVFLQQLVVMQFAAAVATGSIRNNECMRSMAVFVAQPSCTCGCLPSVDLLLLMRVLEVCLCGWTGMSKLSLIKLSYSHTHQNRKQNNHMHQSTATVRQ